MVIGLEGVELGADGKVRKRPPAGRGNGANLHACLPLKVLECDCPLTVCRPSPTPSSCIPPTCWGAGGTPSTPPRPSPSLVTPATGASVWAAPTATRAAWTQVGHRARGRGRGHTCPPHPLLSPLRSAGNELGDFREYDPNLLDDPQWPCGKHKRVLIFPSYMTTVIEYVKPSDLKKDMNETFKEKFPHIRLTLSKIRSLKREIKKLAQDECGYEEPTVAMAFVYFEKLVLQGKLNKQNRKLCAGACVLLAAKIGGDLKKHEVKLLIDKLEERFRVNRRELIAFEFPVLVALEFNLHLPEHEIMPHYRRLLQTS
ncbi:unnamed protein product [Tetraodon nigroviridis]|uniref:(spotted green pufferfish) hypothetical protein n=1 Tax=Tetraodon nigroviridis TaxID=99883 RepID=Q4SEH1_TETNG|nr:unnamed protein product [Tetraodon nigroviridis]